MPRYQKVVVSLKLKLSRPEARRELGHDLVEAACDRAFSAYKPKACNTPVQLIRTTEYVDIEEKERHLRWREVTPSLHIQVLEGEHQTILLEPEVARLAAVVDACINTT